MNPENIQNYNTTKYLLPKSSDKSRDNKTINANSYLAVSHRNVYTKVIKGSRFMISMGSRSQFIWL